MSCSISGMSTLQILVRKLDTLYCAILFKCVFNLCRDLLNVCRLELSLFSSLFLWIYSNIISHKISRIWSFWTITTTTLEELYKNRNKKRTIIFSITVPRELWHPLILSDPLFPSLHILSSYILFYIFQLSQPILSSFIWLIIK